MRANGLLACLACLSCLVLTSAALGWTGGRKLFKGWGARKPKDASGSHQDTPLIMFTSPEADSCPFHRVMKPLIARLESELPVKVQKIVVQGEAENELFETIDLDTDCGGLPFLFNRRSQQVICGATTWENFRNWALGHDAIMTCPPPEADLYEAGLAPVQQQKKKKKTVFSKFQSKLADVKEKGQHTMNKKGQQAQSKDSSDDADDSNSNNSNSSSSEGTGNAVGSSALQ